jgi:peptidyl-prolyl cis-trans isomerase B (cyclophilin B)
MSSARDNRQRAAARARLEREMAARLEAAAKRRRMIRSILGASVASLVLIGAVIWIIVAVSGNKPAPVAAEKTGCEFRPSPTNPTTSPTAGTTMTTTTAAATTAASGSTASASASPTPGPLPDANPPRSGFRLMTITTNLGDVTIQMDLSKTPCTAASMAYLAETNFFVKGTNPQTGSCHRLVADIFVLQCGDPTGTGSGGPGYGFGVENAPKDGQFPAGTLAMARTSDPNSNGGQFFIVYKQTTLQDPTGYSIFGRVTGGMDIVDKIAAAGAKSADQSGNTAPNQPISILKVAVTEKKA